MSTLSSSSTDAQVWDSYDDNASYEEDDSRSKALAFITACRILLRRRPQSANRDGQSVSFEAIADEMERARLWLVSNRSSSQVRERFAEFYDYRDY